MSYRVAALFLLLCFSAAPLWGQAGVFKVTDKNKNSGNLLEMIANEQRDLENPFEKAPNAFELMKTSIESLSQKMVETIVVESERRPEDVVQGAGTYGLASGAGVDPNGSLIVEDVVPQANRGTVSMIDAKTKRYNPRLRIDFNEYPTISGNAKTAAGRMDRVTAQVEKRLNLKDRISLEPLGEETVIRGSVDTPRQRELVESMVRMSPGIDRIRNELKVAPTLNPPIRSTN